MDIILKLVLRNLSADANTLEMPFILSEQNLNISSAAVHNMSKTSVNRHGDYSLC